MGGRGRIAAEAPRPYAAFRILEQDVAGFESEAPFVNIVVELEEQPMLLMVSNLPGAERERVRVDAPVEVHFEARGGELVIPQFRLIGAA